jgi:hypothetical protein
MANRLTLSTDLLDLSSWTTSKNIVKFLSDKVQTADVNRKFRSDVATNNRMFLNGDAEHYIVHGGRGYKWATDQSEIERSIKDLERRAYTMLKSASSARKALNNKNQGTLLNNLADIRKEKKITAEALCRMVNETYPGTNLDPSLLSRIETGKVLPNHFTMVAISEVLGVGAVKLFGEYALLI